MGELAAERPIATDEGSIRRRRAGWSAIAVAGLTVTGMATLVAFFANESPLIGALNEANSVLMMLAMVPVALALHPLAARRSVPGATVALAAGLTGIVTAAGFTALLVTRLVSFEAVLPFITAGNSLVGGWLALTATLLAGGSVIRPTLGLAGIVGGAGLAVTALAYPTLGEEHVAVAVAGMLALVGLVTFFAWIGVLLLQRRPATS